MYMCTIVCLGSAEVRRRHQSLWNELESQTLWATMRVTPLIPEYEQEHFCVEGGKKISWVFSRWMYLYFVVSSVSHHDSVVQSGCKFWLLSGSCLVVWASCVSWLTRFPVHVQHTLPVTVSGGAWAELRLPESLFQTVWNASVFTVDHTYVSHAHSSNRSVLIPTTFIS